MKKKTKKKTGHVLLSLQKCPVVTCLLVTPPLLSRHPASLSFSFSKLIRLQFNSTSIGSCSPVNITHTEKRNTYSPVKERGENKYTDDTEGEDVNDVGQEHLPFLVQSIFTLLISYSSHSRDCMEHSIYVKH